ncbi:54S ribosomal protein L8, mitochondrial [Tilletia horrida]|uniref:54S ribosomal protein L8, mitochondrial n=1 Tax=Tilletia horrida TaxID=155126 RepID=A0AAN6JJH2_9BASI|nr:54S ribosomal protein L8, mitochondrial [Tilletia horrida]
MKGLAFRKLSRTKSHRNALLRNLVTSLFQHDRIVTTVAKAKEAAREAEKIITLGKRALAAGTVPRFAALRAGLDEAHWNPDAAPDAARTAAAQTISQANHTGKGRQAQNNARIYLYSPTETLPQLYTLAERYAARPGGYTRIHMMGNRKGDHAPRAVLELVDGPRDVRLEMTARSVGRQLYVGAAAARVDFLAGSSSAASTLVGREPTLDAEGVEKVVKRFLTVQPAAIDFFERLPEHGRDKKAVMRIFSPLLNSEWLTLSTKKNLVKVTQYGGRNAIDRLLTLAIDHMHSLSAEAELFQQNEEKVRAAHKTKSSTTSGVFANVAPRGGSTTVTPRSADLFVPINSSYTLSSAGDDIPKTRRRYAGEWRPHAIGNTPSAAATAIASSSSAAEGLSSDAATDRRLRRQATHGRAVLRVRRGGSESAIALGKGVFARKRLAHRGLELLGQGRKAGAWEVVEEAAAASAGGSGSAPAQP